MRYPKAGQLEYSDLWRWRKGRRGALTRALPGRVPLHREFSRVIPLGLRVFVHASPIPELDALIARGSPERRVKTLERMTAFFLDGASRFNDDHVRLFDLVFSRLIGEIESTARTELARRLAPVGKAPIETVRRLAHDDDIAVAGPLLERADRLSDADLADIAASKGQAHLLAICARNRIAQPVTDVLLRRGDREVAHRLAENGGARLSDEGFCTLVERAKTDGVLAEKVRDCST